MRIVCALGGNALLPRGHAPDHVEHLRNIEIAASALAELGRDHELVITHGNGPQIGLLAMTDSRSGAPSRPLDVLDAETEGWLGYLIAQAVANALPERETVTVLTRVEVDADDPAFDRPAKPIGALLDEVTAARLRAQRGWIVDWDTALDEDEPLRYRRVVPSPEPRAILEVRALRCLLEAGLIVVCAGGGGIPVQRDADGAYRGVEAVVDKDRVSALLAEELGADRLLLLTDVDGVYPCWPPRGTTRLHSVEVDDVARMSLDDGSMGPKLQSAAHFARDTGHPAAIGKLSDAARILRGDAGTWVTGG